MVPGKSKIDIKLELDSPSNVLTLLISPGININVLLSLNSRRVLPCKLGNLSVQPFGHSSFGDHFVY